MCDTQLSTAFRIPNKAAIGAFPIFIGPMTPSFYRRICARFQMIRAIFVRSYSVSIYLRFCQYRGCHHHHTNAKVACIVIWLLAIHSLWALCCSPSRRTTSDGFIYRKLTRCMPLSTPLHITAEPFILKTQPICCHRVFILDIHFSGAPPNTSSDWLSDIYFWITYYCWRGLARVFA